jgi:glycosyltransferase involved in cell wall biosynthesis
MIQRLGIGWQIGVPSGWGTYGTNLAIQLARRGIEPAALFVAERPDLTEAQAAVLVPVLERHPHWARIVQGSGSLDFPLLHSLGDKLYQLPEFARLKGSVDIGVAFFESAAIPPANLAAAERFALIVAGSAWNAEVLRRHGVSGVASCPQGVDLALFNPGPRSGFFKDRYTVFSGGKLEYRKGQDLAVAAFKRFRQRHTDALLVTAWHNPWPGEAAAFLSRSPHVAGAPGLRADGRLDVAGWLQANGLPDDAHFDAGPMPNAAMPSLLRELDLAVFPNRCEGGTNLVAMECMACGVPVVLSRNTGHLDLIRDDTCYALDLQIPMGAVTGRPELEGWGESSIEELVSRMEQAYADRDAARARGAAAAAFMRSWDWSDQVDALLSALAPVC